MSHETDREALEHILGGEFKANKTMRYIIASAILAAGFTRRLMPTKEQVKQTLSDEGAFCGVCDFEPGDRGCPDCERCWDRYADAVLALLKGGER